MFDEIEKNPLPVNKPASGTYGEKKELNDLKASLPPMNPGAGPTATGPSPMPGASPQMPADPGGRPLNTPPGVPSALMGKTDQPTVPLNTPLAQPQPAPMAGAQSAAQARIVLLQALSVSNEVSEETRAWAKAVLEMLTDGR